MPAPARVEAATSAPAPAANPAVPEDVPDLVARLGTARVPASLDCTTQTPPGSVGPHGAPPDRGAVGRGLLDKEIIRALIRRHIDTVRKCYEAVLLSKPYPAGRVLARFAIDPLGKVRSSCVVSSTLFRLQAETCIVEDILHWEFPKPLGAGWVVVDYPFVLIPSDSSDGADNPDAG